MHVLQLWPNFHWEISLGKWFFKFWSNDSVHEIKIRILAAILKYYIYLFIFFFFVFVCLFVFVLFCFCWIMVFLDVQRYGESFVSKFLLESTLFCLCPTGPPYAHTGVKSSLRTKVLECDLLQQIIVSSNIFKCWVDKPISSNL